MKQKLDKIAFAKAVKTKRVIDLQIGVREAAILIGISSATVSRIENGKEISLENFILACNWLGVSVCEFIKDVKK